MDSVGFVVCVFFSSVSVCLFCYSIGLVGVCRYHHLIATAPNIWQTTIQNPNELKFRELEERRHKTNVWWWLSKPSTKIELFETYSWWIVFFQNTSTFFHREHTSKIHKVNSTENTTTRSSGQYQQQKSMEWFLKIKKKKPITSTTAKKESFCVLISIRKKNFITISKLLVKHKKGNLMKKIWTRTTATTTTIFTQTYILSKLIDCDFHFFSHSLVYIQHTTQKDLQVIYICTIFSGNERHIFFLSLIYISYT